MDKTTLYADLPRSMPVMAQYSNLSNDGKTFAVYTFHSFSAAELENILASASYPPIPVDAESDLSVPLSVALPPSSNCAGLPLRAALERHSTLAEEPQSQGKQKTKKEFHPYFILAFINKNWKDEGVLAVNMNADYNGTIDYLLLSAQGSGAALANIAVGNSSWGETKHDVAQTLKQTGLPDTYEHEIATHVKKLKVEDEGGDGKVGSMSQSTGQKLAVYKSKHNIDMVSILRDLNGSDFSDSPAEKWHFRDPPWVNHVLITISGSRSLAEAEIGMETDNLSRLMEEHERYLNVEAYAGLGLRRDQCLLVPVNGVDSKRVSLISRVKDKTVRARVMELEEVRTAV
jgi:hypothetical protein